jgi:ADP-ribose diphosphatase
MGKKTKKSQVVSSREAYRGPVFWVTTDYVQEPGGVQARRDIVRHQGSVVILAVDDSNAEPRLLLERQYRHAAQDHLWELPAGRIDDGESEMAAARRELLEETGYAARQWNRVLKFYASPGFLDETMALYMAMGLRPGKAQPEEDEVIHARLVPLSEAVSMVGRGAIKDAKTITGILWFDRFVHGPKVRKQRVSRARVT